MRRALSQYVVTENQIFQSRCTAQPCRSAILISTRCLRWRRGDYTSGGAQFESLDRLLKALRSVAPDFDESTVSIRNTPETYIAFARETELDDSQLSSLGLKDDTRT